MNNLCFYIFSFNRGEFLLNCLRSIEACAPGVKVCILDDNSTDTYTKFVLSNIKERYDVEVNSNNRDIEFKTGGLSGAMNTAMYMAQRDNVKLAIFIQDDMQFVRRLSDIDVNSYFEYFESVPNAIQLSTSFIRELSSDTFFADYDIAKNDHAYIRFQHRERGKSSFSDTGVFSVSKFKELFKKFEVGEDVNSRKARELGLVCGRAIYPNMCWLPYPQSFRGKKRTLKHRIFERFGRSGFYPIDIMTEKQEAVLLDREVSIPPVMERFLFSPKSPRHDIWSTGGGEYNFVCYGGLLSKVFIAIRVVKSFFFGWQR